MDIRKLLSRWTIRRLFEVLLGIASNVRGTFGEFCMETRKLLSTSNILKKFNWRQTLVFFFAVLMVLSTPVLYTTDIPGVESEHDGRAVAATQSEHTYVASNAEVRKIDTTDNTVVWTYSQQSGDVEDVAVDKDGNVYAYMSDPAVHKIDSSGNQVWTYTSVTESGGLVETYDNSHLYVFQDGETEAQKLDLDGNHIWTTSHDSFNTGPSTVASNGDLIAGAYPISRFDSDTGDIIWSYQSDGDATGVALDEENGHFYLAHTGGMVEQVDLSTQSQIQNTTIDSNGAYGIAIDSNKHLYAGTGTSETVALYSSDLTQKWEYTGHSDQVWDVIVDNSGHVYSGDGTGEVHRLDPSDGSNVWTDTSSTSRVNHLAAGKSPATSAVSGQVTDSEGQPVSNATVKVVEANHSTFKDLEGSRQAALDAADEAITDADAAKPPQLESFTSTKEQNGWTGSNGALPTDGKYAVAHTQSQWDNPVGSIGGLSVRNPELGTPIIDVPVEETVILSTWDADEESFVEGAVDRDLPGATTSDDIIVRQLGPGGSYVGNNFTAETKDYAETGFKTHQAAEVKLSPGIYELRPESGGTPTYVVAGHYGDLISAWVEEGTDQSGQALERAKYIDQQIADDKFVPSTVTTNETGHFEMQPGSNVERVGLIAYKKPDAMTTVSAENVTRHDIRTWYNNTESYNGSVHAPTPMQLHTVGNDSQGITLRTREISSPSYLDTNRVNEAWAWFQDFLDRHTYAEAANAVQQRLEDLSDEELREHYLEMYQMAKENERIVSNNEDLLNETEAQNATIQELRNQTSNLEQDLQEIENSIDAGDGSSEITNQTLSATQEFGSEFGLDNARMELSPENVQVMVHYANGTTETVPADSEHVTISNNVVGSTVKLEDYPIGDAPAATAHFRIVTEDGMGESRQSARNPAFSGDIPALDSVDYSSLNPGPDESVRLRLNPDEKSSFNSVEEVTVFGPDGSELNTSLESSEEATFTTSGEGVHHVAITYSNPGGHNFTTTQRIIAADETRNMPAEIRAQQSPIGTYVLTGENFEGGSIDVNGGGSSISIAGHVGDDDDPPGTVHVHTHGMSLAPDAETTVSILQGETGKSVNRNVRVVMHTPELSDGALVYRQSQGLVFDGQPLPADEQGKHGWTTKRDSNATINTYTDDDGRVTVRTVESPNRWQKAIWTVQKTTPELSIPDFSLLGFMAPNPRAGLPAGSAATP